MIAFTPSFSLLPLQNGSTALMKASFNGKSETAQVLLRFGANVDAKDKKGKTALEKARKNHSDDHRLIALLS